MGRFDFVLRRLLQTIPLLLGITLLVFLLLKVTPGDPARLILGARATDAQVENLRDKLGLNQSVPVQYLDSRGRLGRGDLGTSIRQGVPVRSLIAEDLPVTAALLVFGSIAACIFALPLAFLAVGRRDRLPDHAVRGVTLVGLTMPSFWVGILLLVLVALPTGLFPVAGYGDNLGDHARALVLPSVTLGIVLAPVMIRSLRSGLITVRGSDYIALARSVGVSRRRVALRHEMPNAMLPVITILAVSIGYALFSVVVIEQTFALPGLGREMLQAVDGRDFPVVQGITLVFALIVVLVHLAADIVYALVDPRVEIQ